MTVIAVKKTDKYIQWWRRRGWTEITYQCPKRSYDYLESRQLKGVDDLRFCGKLEDWFKFVENFKIPLELAFTVKNGEQMITWNIEEQEHALMMWKLGGSECNGVFSYEDFLLRAISEYCISYLKS